LELQLKNVINTIYVVIPLKCNLNLGVSIITICKVSGGHEHSFQFHSVLTPLVGYGRMSWFIVSCNPPFLFWLVGVVCLCGELTLDCKRQNQSCFQLLWRFTELHVVLKFVSKSSC